MNELEKMLLAAILKQSVKKEDTKKEQKEEAEAVKRACELLKKVDLNFAVLTLSPNTDFTATCLIATPIDLFVMLNELFEKLPKDALDCVKDIVCAEINARDKED
ncbi:hypothetical protein [Ligilactobacillus murinus]|uniref:Uncharacterized protein n=1 Tax=Ligilactobacillus murinus TaxID=1622 RepID=A0AAD0L1F1_9LACO|nr:hypothetical protein [Ligilactobacillus murinus]AWZ37937.1 hypothetical protein CPS94_02865 [Ligilactobacillus murinus]AWZ41072.1 hypothetical protein CPQ89_08600 [Ligilactobacillus murinus]HCM78756.1 hypothetical protein [Lactobacillus sp.]